MPDAVIAIAAAMAMAGISALIYLVGFCYRPASFWKTCAKTLAVAPLAVIAGIAGDPPVLILALALCTAGDFLLSRDGKTAFLTSLAAFAAGHIAYIALFLSNPASDIASIPTAAGLALILFGAIMMVLLYRRAGDLRFAVLFYVPVIAGMGLAAMSLPPVGPLWLVLPAAMLFMLSDTILAAELFLLRPGHPLRRIAPFAVWTLYWFAQLGFLAAFALL